MSSISRTTLEDAVIGALQRQIGDKVKTLKTYQGDWREDLGQEGWRLPAVLVSLDEAWGEQVCLASYDLTLEISIILIFRRLRGEAQARREEGGIYDILASIRQTLWHQDLGLAMLPLALVKEGPLLSSREHAVYGARFRTGLMQDF
jgi:phage gp37-like protein